MNSSHRRPLCLARGALGLVAGLLLASQGAAGPVNSFDDVEFWVGSGANRAAIAIDWLEKSIDQPALVWGFRWDGLATGQTMLNAVVSADSRLFAKSEGYGTLGSALYGLGYDDGDGEFSLDDETSFDEFGFAWSEGATDTVMSVDADDRYREGWTLGFWHYGYSIGNPYAGGTWKSSQNGMASRSLQDGDWDSWTFSTYAPPFKFDTFAEAPVAVEPPESGDNSDFNDDGVVDGADFLVWQRGFGTLSGAELAHGDANGDGLVDDADLNAWREAFGTSAPPVGASIAAAVPEPTSFGVGAAALSLVTAIARRNKRRIELRNGVPTWK